MQAIICLLFRHNCILIVDVVATIEVVPFFFDQWEVDASFCNNHKGLGTPVGMAPVSLGPRAMSVSYSLYVIHLVRKCSTGSPSQIVMFVMLKHRQELLVCRQEQAL